MNKGKAREEIRACFLTKEQQLYVRFGITQKEQFKRNLKRKLGGKKDERFNSRQEL